MSESRRKRIKLEHRDGGEDEDDLDVSTVPTRILTRCMSHDYTLLNENDAIEYIRCMKDNDTTQLLDDFILKSRINNILTCRATRLNTKNVKALWYTTTCYLSGKIIILFFTMLRLFSVNIGVSSKTQLIKLWLIVEKMMWEIMTTNSIQIMSDPPSLEMLGQTVGNRLGEFIMSMPDANNDTRNGLAYITSVSRAELDRSVIIEDISSLFSRNYNEPSGGCSFVNSMIPIIAGISISGAGDGIPSGIIHWFSFVVINKENPDPTTRRICVYSSWADGDYPIQSIMTKVEVDIIEFNTMINILTNGSDNEVVIQQTILTLQKYFFSNPPDGSEDVIEYLKSVFLTKDGIIIGGKFQIIMFPNYYKHCINISSLLLQTSITNPTIISEMLAVITTSRELFFDIDYLKLELLLIFLYTKMRCINSGFYQTEESGIKGGKMKRKRSMKRRKTIKRKRRYTRRHKKRRL